MNMKMIVLIISIMLVGASCNPKTDDASAKRIVELESKVEKLEKRNKDIEVKARLVTNSMFDSPLKNFFNADEFWENPYDSGQSDCAARCGKNLTTENAACNKIVDCQERLQCFTDAVQRASNCQTQCSANHPPQIP